MKAAFGIPRAFQSSIKQHPTCNSTSSLFATSPVATMQRTWDPTAQWDPEVEAYLAAALGADRLRAISAATVRPPLTTCLRVNTLRTTPEDVLRRLPNALSPADKELLEQVGRQPYIHPAIPFAVMVPGSGPHHVDYTDCQGLEVIVGRKAGESMLRGSNAYAPGILACTANIAEGDTVAVSVGVEMPGSNQFGITRGSVVPQNLPLDDPRFPNRARLFIGTGRAEVSRSGMNPSGSGLVLTLKERVFKSVALGDVLKGEVMLQNLPSMAAAVVLGPTPGSRVLDMCAAPGGKTTAMAQMMGDKGEVIALDRSHTKARHIAELAEQLGITCVRAFKHDATKAVLDLERVKRRKAQGEVELSERGKARLERIAAMKLKHGRDASEPARAKTTDGFEPESFDYLLLDAPCTALGLRPRLVLPQTLAELHSTAHYQRKLIDAAVRLLKPGGYMVYSTCTINPGENEANVRCLLDRYPFMKLVPQNPRLGGMGLTGSVPGDQEGKIMGLLSEEEAALVQRFDPSSDLDTTGFFIAKFQKVGSSETA